MKIFDFESNYEVKISSSQRFEGGLLARSEVFVVDGFIKLFFAKYVPLNFDVLHPCVFLA